VFVDYYFVVVAVVIILFDDENPLGFEKISSLPK
jgi:hypothetical protein